MRLLVDSSITILNVASYCLLVSIVSNQKSPYINIEDPLYVTSFFFPFKIVFVLQHFDDNVSRCGSLFCLFYLVFVELPGCVNKCFLSNVRIFQLHFLQYFFCSSLLVVPAPPYMNIVGVYQSRLSRERKPIGCRGWGMEVTRHSTTGGILPCIVF